jgi:hypothetical protein
MPLDANGRVILAASLNKIIRKQDISESVADAETVLREYAALAEETQQFRRTRQDGRFLEERLEYQDLSAVGSFQGRKRDKKGARVLSFQNGNQAVEFFFQRREYSATDLMQELVTSGKKYGDGVEDRAIRDILVNTLNETSDFKHPSELTLGKESRTLDHYMLERVDVVEKKPRSVFGIEIPAFSVDKRETVYAGRKE